MATTRHEKGGKASVFSWCLYDWANSAFSTVIITFVYSVYFARGIVGDETTGSAQWSFAIALSGLAIAVASPVLGAVADHYGARKHWLAVMTVLFVIPTALLWFGMPDPAAVNVMFVLTLVVLANIAFEIAIVFANAMLPHIAPAGMMGRVSGWAWGMGYLGGLACLAAALFGLIGLGESEPLLALPREDSRHIRASGPLTALWIVFFTLPLLFFTHDAGRTGLTVMQAIRRGLGQLRETLVHIRRHGNLVRFLIASAIYRDGLNTLFAIGGIYAAGTFGMDFEEILIFAIGLNIAAGLGASLFAFLDDWIGSKPTIMTALLGLIVSGAVILLIGSKELFIMMALVLGIFIGPTQAASRTLAGRLARPDMVTQTFGLYAFTGKSIAFFGPLCFGWATLLFDSQRAGMATILLFWLVGLVLLAMVREKQ